MHRIWTRGFRSMIADWMRRSGIVMAQRGGPFESQWPVARTIRLVRSVNASLLPEFAALQAIHGDSTADGQPTGVVGD